MPAFFSGVPAATASCGADARPTDSGVTVSASMRPSFSSTAWVGPDTLSSSRPSSLDTTSAWSQPSSPQRGGDDVEEAAVRDADQLPLRRRPGW